MAYTLEKCKNEWELSCRCAPKENRIENNAKWIRYWDHLAVKSKNGLNEASPLAANITNTLVAQNILTIESSALDIGAGSGAYSLAFSPFCKEITALDMSLGMLRLLDERCTGLKISNIRTVREMWEEYDKTQKYDVVFSAMCPAVCDMESLLKMERHSKRHCILLTVGQGSSSKIRSSLRPLITNDPLSGLSPDVIYIFNVLYALGKLPELKFYPMVSNPSMSVDDAVETYRIYYEIFGFSAEKTEPVIRNYLGKIAMNGVCTDEVKINMALLHWCV